jgi:drug/metabolite transporter (DMT)-like permease
VPPRANNPRLGITLMILTTLIFAFMDALSRHLAATYSVMTVTMIRYWVFAGFVLVTAAASPAASARWRAPVRLGRRWCAGCCSPPRFAWWCCRSCCSG